MIKAIKIMLVPNNKQKTKLFECCGVSRFAYNWTLSKQKENYESGGKFIQDGELRKQFTILKKGKEYDWLNNYSNNITKQSIKDACNSFKRFFNKQSKFPRYKSKRKSKQSFFVDNVKIKFTETKVKLEKLSNSTKGNKKLFNWVRLAEKGRIPLDSKYYNPRITYDGINFWLSVGIEIEKEVEIPTNEGVGIDLGLKDLAICSDKTMYKNINKSKRVKRIEKRKRRLQRSKSRKYLKNRKGESYQKTSNIIKSNKKLLRINHRLNNIRNNYLHQITTEIINRKPKFITVEDLNVKGMMKNKKLSRAFQEECLNKFYEILKYKCKINKIEFRVVSRFYPSSKICHNCGNIKKDLKLSDRTYKCNCCSYVEDRDYNASLNLRDALKYEVI